jgi:ketosteroid isomerase-like protein
MKMPSVVAIVFLVIGLAMSTFAQQKDTFDRQIAQQIRVLAMKFHEAINRNDAAAIAALYTEDGVNVGPEEHRMVGRPSKKVMHGFFRVGIPATIYLSSIG